MRNTIVAVMGTGAILAAPGPALAAVPNLPQSLRALPAGNSFVTPPVAGHPVRNVVEGVLSQARKLKVCDDAGLARLQNTLQALSRAVNNLANAGGGNQQQRQLAQQGVTQVLKDFVDHRAAQKAACAKQAREAASERRQREIKQCISDATFPDLKPTIGLRNANLRLLRSVILQSTRTAQASCDTNTLERLKRQVDRLVDEQNKKVEAATDAARKRGENTDLRNKQLVALAGDGAALQELSDILKGIMVACKKRRELNIPKDATPGQVRSIVAAAVDKKIATENAKAGDGAAPQRQAEPARNTGEKTEDKPKAQGDDKNASIDGTDGDKVARSDRQIPTVTVDINAGFNTTGGTNNSLATAQQNGSIIGAGKSGGGNGFSHNTKITFPIGNGTSFIASFGASRSKGTSTFKDPNGIGYIPYINGNPLVGLGQTGINARATIDVLLHHLEMELLNDEFEDAFGVKLFNGFSGGGGATSGWKFGLIGGLGLRVQHNRLVENIGMNALTVSAGHHTKFKTTSIFVAPKITLGVKGSKEIGKGKLFGSLVAVIAPGITTASGRGDQAIHVLNARANPMTSDRATRANVQTAISATIGYTFWGIRAGVTGTWQWEANRAFMRMPVATGGARIHFRPAHSFAFHAFVKIPLY